MNKYLYFLVFAFSFWACEDSDDCPSTFQVPAEIIPNKSQFKVGETLTIRSVFSKNIQELRLKKYYNFENVPMSFASKIFRLDTIGAPGISIVGQNILYLKSQPGAYILKIGTPEQSTLTGNYLFSSDSFYVDLKLLPVSKGIYFLDFRIANFYDRFPGQCNLNKEQFWSTNMNKNAKNNVDFLRLSIDPYYSEYIVKDTINFFHKNGGFCFKVE